MIPISIPLIQYLDNTLGSKNLDLQNLVKTVDEKWIQAKERLLNEGDFCQNYFYVISGLLKMYTIDDNGKEHIIQFASEGWLIADRNSLYLNKRAEVYIEAIEETNIAILDNHFFYDLGQKIPAFHKINEELLHRHISQLQNRILQLLSVNAEGRYLEFVKLYPDLLLRVPQWMIASYLGITPEGLSRIRKELSIKNNKK